jgi:hypothetical protein
MEIQVKLTSKSTHRCRYRERELSNRVHDHHSESELQFCLYRFKLLEGKKIPVEPRVARIMAKKITVEGSRTSFKLLMSLYLPVASKYLEKRKIRKASLLVCKIVFRGLFGTRPGGALSNCSFSRITREKSTTAASRWRMGKGSELAQTRRTSAPGSSRLPGSQ